MSANKDRPNPAIYNHGEPITVEVMVRLQAIALPEADGGFSVAVPALPGCNTMGETLDEVRRTVVEAAEGWLEAGHDREKAEAIRDLRGES